MLTEYQLITTPAALAAACEELARADAVGFDCETTSLDPFAGRLRLMQFATPGGRTYLVDLFRLADDADAARGESLEPLRRLLAAARPVKTAHNVKFDAKWTRHHLGTELGGVFDTMLASQLISAGATDDRHGLAAVVARYLGEEVDKTQQVSDWGGQLSDSQLEYAARDAAVMLPLRGKLVERLKADNLIKVAQLEFECVLPVAALELAGLYLDRPCWLQLMEDEKKRRDVLYEELQTALAGESQQGSLFGPPTRDDINLDSHVQLKKALARFGIKDLPDSTRNWKLEPLAKDHPVIGQLLEYRTRQKSTKFGESILKAVGEDGRIRANFHQIGAPTGRFACSDPNIQQIPHSEEYRRCFRAQGDGRKLVIADYCVAKGTRVATAHGLMPVESVRPGENVYLEDGSTAGVSAVIRRGRLPVVRLTLRNGYSLVATSLHRVRVLDAAGEYVWRRIGELRATDCVAVQPGRGLPRRGEDCVELPAALNTHHNNHKTLSTPARADERLAAFLGYVTGDGSLRASTLSWVVNQQDADVASWARESAAEMFGVIVHERGSYRGVIESGIYSTPLAAWCESLGVGKDRVPEFLWASPAPVVAAFLRGLFEADGSVTDSEIGKVSFASSRRRLAAEVQQLLLALGVPATLRRQDNTGPGKRFSCWTVSVLATGVGRFSEQVGFLSARKRGKLTALSSRWTGKTVAGNMPNLQAKVPALALSGEKRRLLNNTLSLGRPVSTSLAARLEQFAPSVAESLGLEHLTRYKQLFLPVVSVEPAGEEEVFDLSVPGPMTYLSDGFVSHNSQIELRILAHVTEDKGFIEAFNSGADLHRVTAAQIFNTTQEGVTREQRDFAKRLNFGVVYGIGAQRFSIMTGLPLSDAEQIMARYFQTYRGLDTWLREAARGAVRERQSRTMSGRLARFNFDAEDRQAVSAAQRNGKNMPIQGCVSGETRVFEESAGYVAIRELDGRAVSVWDGARFAKARVAASGKKQLVKVELWGGHYIECSPDHKFLTTDVNGRTNWRTPGEFVKGNYVAVTEALGEWSAGPCFPKLEAGATHNASRASLADAADDPFGLGVWLGRLASDGTLGKRQLNLLVAQHEEIILPQIRALSGRFGHISYRAQRGGRGPKLLHSLTISALGLVRQLHEAGLKTRVPDFAWQDSRLLAGYLRGMFDGDGTVTPDGPALCFGRKHTHLAWAREIQQALLLFGVESRLNLCADRINVCVRKKDAALFAEKIGFVNPRKQAKVEAVRALKPEGKIYGRAVRIKSVEFTDEWANMYDVIDSETGRFMANGLVTHNSSADILKRALRLLHDRLRDTSAEIVNIVHDEIVVECEAAQATEVAGVVERSMCEAGEELVTLVPVKVETQVSDAWVK